jgi:hypothetical protein
MGFLYKAGPASSCDLLLFGPPPRGNLKLQVMNKYYQITPGSGSSLYFTPASLVPAAIPEAVRVGERGVWVRAIIWIIEQYRCAPDHLCSYMFLCK